jgi:hypothetical protein
MSMQRVEDSPVVTTVTAGQTLTLVRDTGPLLPTFERTRRAPKSIPDFEDRSQDLVPVALPTTWEASGS